MTAKTTENRTGTTILAGLASGVAGLAAAYGCARTLFTPDTTSGIAIVGASLAWGTFLLWLVHNQPGAVFACLLGAAGAVAAAVFLMIMLVYLLFWIVLTQYGLVPVGLLASLTVAHRFRQPWKASIAGGVTAALTLWILIALVGLFIFWSEDDHTYEGPPAWWLAIVSFGIFGAHLAVLAAFLGWFAAKKE